MLIYSSCFLEDLSRSSEVEEAGFRSYIREAREARAAKLTLKISMGLSKSTTLFSSSGLADYYKTIMQPD